jgi:hypothetical protein
MQWTHLPVVSCQLESAMHATDVGAIRADATLTAHALSAPERMLNA